MGDDEKHVEQAALEHEDLDDKSETERTPTRRSRRMHAQDEQEDMEAVVDAPPPPSPTAPHMDGTESGDEGVTRCVCGSPDENLGLMIQCETCKSWQHCACMGMHTEEDCPDVYYCEQCRPENHIELLRSLGFLSAKIQRRGTSRQSGRPMFSRESAQALREARDAIREMAIENAARLRGHAPSKPVATPRSASESRAMPKRRTMNSRDFGEDGWEPIPPELLREDENDDHDQDDASDRKRKRFSDEANEHVALDKRRRTEQRRSAQPPDETHRETPQPEARLPRKSKETEKPKHANQYTYRHKQDEDTQPAPAPPSLARSREGRRPGRAQDSASRSGTPQPDASHRATAHHTLPEHLSHLAYLLPPVLEEEEPRAPMQPPRPGLPPPFECVTPIDTSIKIRFPQKRMTMGEMRKRVRVTGEYMTRIQLEAVDREKRVAFLRSVVSGDKPSTDELPLSMQLADQLSRDLAAFQRRFGMQGTLGSRTDDVASDA